MSVELRDGSSTADPRLDRLPLFDERSRLFQVQAQVEPRRAAPRRRYWNPAPGLDQGQEGACVKFADAHALNGSPGRMHPRVTAAEAFDAYHRTQHLDPWDGCALGPSCPVDPRPETYSGTAVLAGAEESRARGLISSYWWVGAGSGDVGQDVVDTLDYVGGINFGLGWKESMFEPRPSGLLEVDDGPFVGGHAIWSFEHAWRGRFPGEGGKPLDVVWLQQSWGPEHGVRRRGYPGCVAIRLEDLVTKLLEADGHWAGEGCVYVK